MKCLLFILMITLLAVPLYSQTWEITEVTLDSIWVTNPEHRLMLIDMFPTKYLDIQLDSTLFGNSKIYQVNNKWFYLLEKIGSDFKILIDLDTRLDHWWTKAFINGDSLLVISPKIRSGVLPSRIQRHINQLNK